MSKITLSGHIQVPLSEPSKVKEALPQHIAMTKSEPGCIVFKVQEHPTIEGRFDVYEEFGSRKAFEHHQKRVRDSTWGNITTHVQRQYTIDGLDH